MIKFLSNWIEQIALSVIIVSIFELILPNGNLKKYIKVVLGMYIVFCIISPFVDSSSLYKIENIENYIGEINKKQTILDQNSMDLRLQNLYIDQLKKDLEVKLKEKGYILCKCDINANLQVSSSNPGIHKINLILKENKIDVEKVEIGSGKENQFADKEKIEKLREDLAKYYEISKEIVEIKVN